ncbi:MAG: hypothetical protein MUE69_16170 [Myxococcota bacterium]|jgi:hypothetical protein|nr:hypothetical protein [Myxococcota bacterium]
MSEMTPEEQAEAVARFSLLTRLAPEIRAIKGVASGKTAVAMSKGRFVITIKKDDEALKRSIRELIAQHSTLEVDFVIATR